MTRRRRLGNIAFATVIAALSALSTPIAAGAEPLRTPWADDVAPDHVLEEYPRPLLVRAGWTNLNGTWQYAIRPAGEGRPARWDGSILVPFPVEAHLSGVGRSVGADEELWYRREFEARRDAGARVLLHFGAVDWETRVWVNGHVAGTHRGAYDPFTFDITAYLDEAGTQELVVRVWDPTDAGHQPRGKQVRRPGGIWYTAVTGIWQTVWLETVPPVSIAAVRTECDAARGEVTVAAPLRGRASGAAGLVMEVQVVVDDAVVARDAAPAGGAPVRLALRDPRRWSPDDPFLYELDVRLLDGPREVDRVSSYFALRSIDVRPDEQGHQRLWLNDAPVFQIGPLDQGWWPDGLYTAPTDEALRFDIEVMKDLGFNMCRKHVKVEPARWYYWCDRLGLMVWQDMPSGDASIGSRDEDLLRTAQSARAFRAEYSAIVEALRGHPCVVAWVPFNEGWGQFATNEILAWAKALDPGRVVDGPSGWTDRGGGDMHDMHAYPGPGMFPATATRASVLGEFGGLGLVVEGHLWRESEGNWGYRSLESPAALQEEYEGLIEQLRPLIGRGLAAAVYTQLTDVETEVNGVLTYDRRVLKLDAARARTAHARLLRPPPLVRTLLPTSEDEGRSWRWTTRAPSEAWTQEAFDDSSWPLGAGGFGRAGTPGAVVRTEWTGREIWLRQAFTLDEAAAARARSGDVRLRLHHDEDVEVYVNGALVLRRTGWTTNYVDAPVSAALRGGTNVIAVHCRQTDGGQYIDAGLAIFEERDHE